MFDPLFPRLFEEFEDSEPDQRMVPDPEERGLSLSRRMTIEAAEHSSGHGVAFND